MKQYVSIQLFIICLILTSGCYHPKFNTIKNKLSDNLFFEKSYHTEPPTTRIRFFDKKGKAIDSNIYLKDFWNCGNVFVVKNTDELYGIISRTGQVIWEPQFMIVSKCVEGLSRVRRKKYSGYLDEDGMIVLPIQFLNVTYFGGMCISAQDSTKNWGLYSPSGDKLTTENYGEIYHRRIGNIVVFQYRTNGNYGILNKMGEIVLDAEFHNFIDPLDSEYLRLEKQGKWGIIDGNANVIVDFIYDFIFYKDTKTYEGKLGEKSTMIYIDELGN